MVIAAWLWKWWGQALLPPVAWPLLTSVEWELSHDHPGLNQWRPESLQSCRGQGRASEEWPCQDRCPRGGACRVNRRTGRAPNNPLSPHKPIAIQAAQQSGPSALGPCSFHHTSPGDRTQEVRLSSKPLHPLSCLASSQQRLLKVSRPTQEQRHQQLSLNSTFFCQQF